MPLISSCSDNSFYSEIYQIPNIIFTEKSRENAHGARGGWGTAEATEMVTNNLFYITVKFGDAHPQEVEELWAAICACWPKNLRIIIRWDSILHYEK